MSSSVGDRDRLAADLYGLLWSLPPEDGAFDQPEEWWMTPNEMADRLIALGWTRLGEERLARAIDGYVLPPEANRPMSYIEARRHVAAAIAKAYREDTE